MKADAFLSRCEKVKSTGNGTWLACCPAHDDKHPSMTVRELEDGRVLVHCFAGCSVEEILGAVGLDFGALFPDAAIAQHVPAVRAPWPAADVLAAVKTECEVVLLLAGDIEEGRALKDTDIARARLARQRVRDACDLAFGKATYRNKYRGEHGGKR